MLAASLLAALADLYASLALSSDTDRCLAWTLHLQAECLYKALMLPLGPCLGVHTPQRASKIAMWGPVAATQQEHQGGCPPWPACPSCHTLTVESRAPVANMRPPGAQEHAQMTRACAFITLPTSLNGCPPADRQSETLQATEGSPGVRMYRPDLPLMLKVTITP